MLRKLVFAVIGLFCLSASVSAQLKMGYVDSQLILNKLPTAVEAQQKLEEQSNVWAMELQKMGEELRSLQQQLEQQSLLLSDAKKKEKQDKIQQLYINSQQFQNEKWGENGAFFQKRNELLQPIFDQINKAIKAVGEKEDYDFIFDSVSGNILHAKEKYDLTTNVLEELGVDTSDMQ